METTNLKRFFSALPLLAAACSSTPPIDYCLEAAAHEASITLGTGENSFEAIEEGALLTPYWGPQGGHHIWASFEAKGINPGQGEMVSMHTGQLDGGYSPLIAEGDDPVMITLEVSLPDQEIGPYQGTYTLFANGDTSASSVYGLTAIIDLYGLVDSFPEEESIPASLWISVVDGCGTVVTDRKNFQMQLADVDGIYSYAD